MKVLNQQELKTIEYFFQLKQPQLLKAMARYLESNYSEVIATDEFVLAVGDIPVAVTAHLDTVFKQPPQNIFYDRVKNVMFSGSGLGADDRAGVYAIVQIVRSGLRPTVILTTDEELGCLGASDLINHFPQAPVELKYIIELDRRGANDCVFYDCENIEFNAYVESFGFITNFGSYSDISIICPNWGVAGVNLSVGYYNEHSIGEILHIGQLYGTIGKVKKMLNAVSEAPNFKYISRFPKEKWNKIANGSKWDWDPSYGISKEEWATLMEPQSKCNQCGRWDFDYNLFPTKMPDGKTAFYCSDCLSSHKHVHWCAICGEPFIDKSLKQSEDIVYCYDCRGNINADT